MPEILRNSVTGEFSNMSEAPFRPRLPTESTLGRFMVTLIVSMLLALVCGSPHAPYLLPSEAQGGTIPTRIATQTATDTSFPSLTPTEATTLTATPTATATNTQTATPTSTASRTFTHTPTATRTLPVTPTGSQTPNVMPSVTETATCTPTLQPTTTLRPNRLYLPVVTRRRTLLLTSSSWTTRSRYPLE